MSAFPYSQYFRRSQLKIVPSTTKSRVKIRLQVQIHHSLQPSSIFYHLTSDVGLAVMVNSVRSKLGNNNEFDMEWVGTIERVKEGLIYLESLGLRLKGKANPDGDSWYY